MPINLYASGLWFSNYSVHTERLEAGKAQRVVVPCPTSRFPLCRPEQA